MVIPLGPGKFYGSSLPRPRIYNDVKFNTDRVDPPLPVNASLLSWAEEAHWSMGGLSFKRIRLQGKIEGNADKLRKFLETKASPAKLVPKQSTAPLPKTRSAKAATISPPRPPKLLKRKFILPIDSDSDTNEEVHVVKKKPARKLVAEFDRVAKQMETRRNAVAVTDLEEKGTAGNLETETKLAEISNQKVSNAPELRMRKTVRSNEKIPTTVRVSPRLASLRSR